nr:protein rep [Bacillus cereus group sp. N6]
MKDITVKKELFDSVIKNIEYNRIMIYHYGKLHEETKEEKMFHKKDRMQDCNSLWILDKYEQAKVMDFKKTNLCKDKFCSNCKKLKQASRMGKFVPLLQPYAENMYQLTLTVPNVKGEQLEETINRLFKSFATLIEYLKCKKLIKDIDFKRWKYQGAIRSLEVTYKKVKKGRGFTYEYHPHLHALIVFEGEIGERIYENEYSKDYLGKRAVRKFSKEEILIQKIWRLLNEGKKVTLKAIESLDRGYSCQLDKFKPEDFIELFKYMTKTTSENDEMMDYKQFKTLYYSLLNKRQIQGYGVFFNIKDDDEISLEEVNKLYDERLEEMREKENPVETAESPQDLRKNKEYIVISRNQLYQELKKIKNKK